MKRRNDRNMIDIPVSKDGERASLDEAKLQYVGEDVGWAGLWQYRDYQIEIRIDGDEQDPYAGFVQLAQIVLPKLEEIEGASNVYLRQFLDNDEVSFYKGRWTIRSLRMRWDRNSRRLPGIEFEVMLSVSGDDYGQWGVGFRYHSYPSPSMLSPYLFSRRQS